MLHVIDYTGFRQANNTNFLDFEHIHPAHPQIAQDYQEYRYIFAASVLSESTLLNISSVVIVS